MGIGGIGLTSSLKGKECEMKFILINGKAAISNHFSVGEFEEFCQNLTDDKLGYSARVGRKIFHRGDWTGICKWLPNLRAGLAIYEIIKERN